LGLLLFLISQFTLALHSHDLSLHPDDTDECVVCLVSNAGDPAPPGDAPRLHFPPESSHHTPVPNKQISQPQQTTAQPRAPPVS
ncbi:MAG: hypothetical protein AMJ55_12675, partial [Gammaproteobacteria bacterium SG8_15]